MVIARSTASRRISSRTSLIPCGSSPDVGSSRMMSSGNPSSACAMPEPLLHAVRERLDGIVGARQESDDLEHFVDLPAVRSGRGARRRSRGCGGRRGRDRSPGARRVRRRARARPAGARQSVPNSSTPPVVGFTSVRIIRMVVLLPAPFGPRNPKTSPRRTARFRSLTAQRFL